MDDKCPKCGSGEYRVWGSTTPFMRVCDNCDIDSVDERDLTWIRQRIAELESDNQRLREALKRIERWHGEFPPSGQFWDGEAQRPIAYGTAFGSNGERDYMRGIARKALEANNG